MEGQRDRVGEGRLRYRVRAGVDRLDCQIPLQVAQSPAGATDPNQSQQLIVVPAQSFNATRRGRKGPHESQPLGLSNRLIIRWVGSTLLCRVRPSSLTPPPSSAPWPA